MIEKTLEWGEDYFGKEYGGCLKCTNDECPRAARGNFEFTTEEYHSSVAIGVRLLKYGTELKRPYILTCKCPECDTKYWFHITEAEATRMAIVHKPKQ